MQKKLKTAYKVILDHFEHYPNVLRTVTISTVIICTTIVIMTVADAREKSAAHMLAQLKLNNELAVANINLEKEKAQAEARRAEAVAATNPHSLEAIRNKECSPLNLTITTNEHVGRNDSETENNIHASVTVDKTKYSPEQKKLMTLTYHIGKEVGYPETMQAILLIETRAGRYGNRIGDTNLPVGERSYGVMQVKARTARHVLKLHPKLLKEYFPNRKLKSVRDEEIIIKMIQDDVFNIKVATLYYAYGRDRSRKKGKGWAGSVVHYNQGHVVEAPKDHVYYKKVTATIIKDVRPFNNQLGLSSK